MTLTGYMIGGSNSDSNRVSDMLTVNSDCSYYTPRAYTNSSMEMDSNNDVGGENLKNGRSNSCTCSEKGE